MMTIIGHSVRLTNEWRTLSGFQWLADRHWPSGKVALSRPELDRVLRMFLLYRRLRLNDFTNNRRTQFTKLIRLNSSQIARPSHPIRSSDQVTRSKRSIKSTRLLNRRCTDKGHCNCEISGKVFATSVTEVQ